MKNTVRALLVAAIICYAAGAYLLTHLFTPEAARSLSPDPAANAGSAEVVAQTAPASEFAGPQSEARRQLLQYLSAVESVTGSPASVPAAVNRARSACVAVAGERLSGSAAPVDRAVDAVSAAPDVSQTMAVQLVAAGMKYACPDVGGATA